ncbi:conserved hypothetical protein [Hyella patelloides LEGE 07179]|uniref:Uncharacterized protein n=1 Tax=Hyella patelloides LEGE 07179 TaxID=945734 RepID=A0A563VUE6_9CYAN|nr:type III-B CRISPR-associated protein Cas10/Cmr2 [Hyella patelloides]VEP14891.1 conserved hypothetical protein [Hyella patelloides LEGE 07179]VEP14894.1 conserved hypothetical protein [Hyella patelloides LEGE 07179]
MAQIESVSQQYTQVGVLTFSPVQAFLGGGRKLRDWAVGSWLCHYLTAAIIDRWERDLKGKVLMPLTYNCKLSKWLSNEREYPITEEFWRASLPNVITGLHSQDNWQEIAKSLVREEWQKLVKNLETVTIRPENYRHSINGIGWKTIKRDCDCLWSVYSDSFPLDPSTLPETISQLHQRIDTQKQGRRWNKSWWAGRTSPTDASLSIWHPGMQPIDNPQGKGRWGMPYGELNLWWEKLASSHRKTGIFDSSDRLNSLELIKRLSSLPKIIEPTLEQIWSRKPPLCPWERFPDSSAAAATWIVDGVAANYWNKQISSWQKTFLPKSKASAKWGIDKVDKNDFNYGHPRVLERRNVRDYWKSRFQKFKKIQQNKLAKWDATIPASWDCTIEWTVGWRGDGDDIGSWISEEQFQKLRLDKEQWHLAEDKFTRHRGIHWHPNGYQLYQDCNLARIFNFLTLFQFWNELLIHLSEKEHYGKVIFAGGDDFLVLGGLHDAIPLTSNLYRLWRGEATTITSPTEDEGWVKFEPEQQRYPVPGKFINFSLGIVIAQRRIPQSLWHRGLEKAYKEAKLAGKNRVCLNILFNSNQSFKWICPWSLWTLLMEETQPDTQVNTALNRWEKLLFYIERTKPQANSRTQVKKLLTALLESVGIALNWDNVRRAVRNDGRQEIENWQWWQDWVSIRAFLARQQLKQEQWKSQVFQEAQEVAKS